MDSAKLVLDANKATLWALAFCSSLAGTGSNPSQGSRDCLL